MANSASDARHSEAEIRRRLIEDGLVDVMVAVGPNFFYTVTLPVTLWFLDRGKRGTPSGRTRCSFIDARQIFRQVDRAHRDFTDGADRVPREHRPPLPGRGAGVRRRGERAFRRDASRMARTRSTKGLCKVATIEEIEAQGWSLNPGRYVGTEVEELEDEVFEEKARRRSSEAARPRDRGSRARRQRRRSTHSNPDRIELMPSGPNSGAGATVVLGELVDSIGGLWGEAEEEEGRIPVVAVRGTDFERVRRRDFREVPRRFEKPRAVERRVLDADCVLIEASGGSKDQPVGRTLLIEEDMIAAADQTLSAASFCKILRVDSARAEPRFIEAILRNAYENGEIERFQTQSTGLRNLRTRQLLEDFEFRLPPLKEQRRACRLLAEIDESILCHERRASELKQVVQRLYRHRFGRPGDADRFESRACALGDVLDLKYGRALPKRKRREGEFAVVSSAGIIDSHDTALVEGPGIVVGRKGNVGSVWWVDGPFFPIDTTYYVQSESPFSYLYWLLRDAQFVDSHAAVPGLSRDQALSLEVRIPPLTELARFGEVHDEAFEAIAAYRALAKECALLRSLLLPRLVDGRLDTPLLALADGA